MGLRVGIVQINVTDLAVAWDFYVNRLGIHGRWLLGPGRPFELDLGPGAPTVLVYRVERVRPSNYPHESGVTLVFHTDDVASTVAAWSPLGVRFVPITWSADASGIAPTPFGPFIAFKDPFGTVHELLEPRSADDQE